MEFLILFFMLAFVIAINHDMKLIRSNSFSLPVWKRVLTKWIIQLGLTGRPLCKRTVMTRAQHVNISILIPDNKKPSRNWICIFLRRRPPPHKRNHLHHNLFRCQTCPLQFVVVSFLLSDSTVNQFSSIAFSNLKRTVATSGACQNGGARAAK